MARVLVGDQLRTALESQTFIKGDDVKCAASIKYDFRMRTRILKASFAQPIDMKNMSEAERIPLTPEPGEVIFVLTEERGLILVLSG